MLRTTSTPVRALTSADRDKALELCARDPAANVFVAARILDGALDSGVPSLWGVDEDGDLAAMVWALANVVPVETTASSRAVLADRVRRHRRRCASYLGPSDQVLPLWELTGPHLLRPRAIRASQPLMGITGPPLGAIDPRVRPGRPHEVDLVLPASARMFTDEIGYPPYVGDERPYRAALRRLLEAGQTYVVVERGEVIFKADVGSVALGCAQVQGVWLAPGLRGQGLAAGLMAAVIEQIRADHAPFVTLYVNDFNVAARATYRRIGMVEIGEYATILL
ncbi:GNAT family N-acetyltransferase [Janibacter sp. G56]|uniref:GNAT family N-acetyltransferase n=1 Tax=Janibacter sp. G56 TaxID=3418717 RepID=UPI003CFDF4CD